MSQSESHRGLDRGLDLGRDCLSLRNGLQGISCVCPPRYLLSSDSLKPVVPITFMEYVFPSAPGWPLLHVLQPEHLGPPGRLSASSGAEPGFSGLIADEADRWGTRPGP